MAKTIILTRKKEQKTGYDLKRNFGVLKGDREYDKIIKELKPLYRKWTKRYV